MSEEFTLCEDTGMLAVDGACPAHDPIARARALLEQWGPPPEAGEVHDAMTALADECDRLRKELAELVRHHERHHEHDERTDAELASSRRLLARFHEQCEENTGHRFDSDGECMYCGMERSHD